MDIWLNKVLPKLGLNDLLNFTATSKQFQASEDKLWLKIAQKRFGQTKKPAKMTWKQYSKVVSFTKAQNPRIRLYHIEELESTLGPADVEIKYQVVDQLTGRPVALRNAGVVMVHVWIRVK